MTAGACQECARRMAGYISAVRSTRKLLQSMNEAARVGVIDDVGFLNIETNIDQAVTEQRRVREVLSVSTHGRD